LPISRRVRLLWTVAIAIVLATGLGAVAINQSHSSHNDPAPTTPQLASRATAPLPSTNSTLAPRRRPPPSSRRLAVTFIDSFAGRDGMIVKYYSHDNKRVLAFTCANPTERFTNNPNGYEQTWTSVGTCGEATGHQWKFAATFGVNYGNPNMRGPYYLYLKVWYSPTVSYRFACAKSPRYRTWSPTEASETRKAGPTRCVIDEKTFAMTPCGSDAAPPPKYDHIVVIMLENRTWNQVGGLGFGAMPHLQNYARQCTYYLNWIETNPDEDSLTQYIGLTSGIDNPETVDNCPPSPTCQSTADNIFRQVRESGGITRSYVEGATSGCEGATHRANVPAMYYYGGKDHSYCTTEVRPLTEMNPDKLPTFAMITPSRCDNGHDCGLDIVDAWVKVELFRLINGESYRAGKTAIFVLYDEDRPAPNLIIAPTSHKGLLRKPIASHSEALHTFEEMLGLPFLPSVKDVISLRPSANL
jgi:hypothetical protein